MGQKKGSTSLSLAQSFSCDVNTDGRHSHTTLSGREWVEGGANEITVAPRAGGRAATSWRKEFTASSLKELVGPGHQNTPSIKILEAVVAPTFKKFAHPWSRINNK